MSSVQDVVEAASASEARPLALLEQALLPKPFRQVPKMAEDLVHHLDVLPMLRWRTAMRSQSQSCA
jgi:hypothetical protein